MTGVSTERRTGIERRSGLDRRHVLVMDGGPLTEARVLEAEMARPDAPASHDVSPSDMEARVDTHGRVRSTRAEEGSLLRLIWPGILVGMGLAGLMDSIVFHQILQWHHTWTPGTTGTTSGLDDVRIDGWLALGSAVAVALGILLLWMAASRHPHRLWRLSGLSLIGWIAVGWASYNLTFISLAQWIFDRHHLYVEASAPAAWDWIFLALSAALGVLGLGLAAGGHPRDVANDDWMG